MSDKAMKQNELTNIEKEIAGIQDKELNSKFLQEQKEKIISTFKNFNDLNYDIVNSFIDYIEIGKKVKKGKLQDIVIHWNF
jgi:hypothetical protein